MKKTVTILGRKYKIKVTTQAKITEVAGTSCEACVDFGSKTIYIWNELPEDEQFISLIHEIQHIGHFVCGASQVISPEMQEILCETTAQAFFDMIRSLYPGKK